MILSITDVAELKKETEERFSAKIHFHDGCGGQYFIVENLTEELKGFITAFFSKRNLKAVFLENGFTVKGIL